MPYFLVAGLMGIAPAREDRTRSQAALHLPPGELAAALAEELWLAVRCLAAPLVWMTTTAVAAVFVFGDGTPGPVLEGGAQASIAVVAAGVAWVVRVASRRRTRGRIR